MKKVSGNAELEMPHILLAISVVITPTQSRTGVILKTLISATTFFILMILIGLVLTYFHNPTYYIILMMIVILFLILITLSIHLLAMIFMGLTINNDYFQPPHQGIPSFFSGRPRTVMFEEVESAVLFRDKTGNLALLRIEIISSAPITLRMGDYGVTGVSFNELVSRLDAMGKLDTRGF